MTLELSSPAFEPGAPIPSRHSCEGDGISPPLTWTGVPSGTKSFALIIDDPDAPDPAAPKRIWVHWVLYNLPPEARELATGADTAGLPAGTTRGVNDYKRDRFDPPCPPIGRHRYVHKLYALDTRLDLDKATKPTLEAAMTGHILAEAVLIGTYQKGDE